MTEKLLKLEDVCAMLMLSKKTVYGMVYLKRIPCIKVSRKCLRFRKVDIDKWLKSKEAAVEDRVLAKRSKKIKSTRPDPVIDRIVERAKSEVQSGN